MALGSNLGDRLGFLQLAVNGLPSVQQVSPVYETEPIGGPENQGAFLNAVVELAPTCTARELFHITSALEVTAKRKREIVNGPRTLDIDLLLYDTLCINDADLVVPHPRMWQRRFVMQPLADIAPDVVPTDWESRVSPGAVVLANFALQI